MVKAYLRYEQAGAFGVISSGCNVVYDAAGKQLFTGALEGINAWNVRQGTQAATLSPDLPSSSTGSSKAAPEVTRIALSPDGRQLAAGYADGSVRLWDVAGRSCLVTLSGHSGAVTALGFSASGALLASGSADTTLIVWDVVGEAGLCRFKGHRDAVTDLALLHQGAKLVSASKDGSVRVWDVALQHCSQTLLGFKGEVWSLAADPAERRLVAGCVDSDLRVFAIRAQGEEEEEKGEEGGGGSESDDAEAEPAGGGGGAAAARRRRRHELLVPMGTVRRAAQERVSLVRFDAGGQLLGVMGAGKGLELFRVRSEEEAVRKAKRRKKRKKEKSEKSKAAKTAEGATAGGHQPAADDDGGDDWGGAQGEAPGAPQASDEMGSLLVVTSKHKLRSFAFCPSRPKGCLAQLALGLSNNSCELVDVAAEGSSYSPSARLDLPGHRGDVRCLSLSSDDAQLLSGSAGGCKIWDPAGGSCLGTLETGYALCCAYAPGDRHALVGTKEGLIQLVDVGACSVIQSQQAHAGPVWSLALLPDKSGFVSGSADKTIRFWSWEVVEEEVDEEDQGQEGAKRKKGKGKSGQEGEGAEGGGAARRLGFSESRSLEMADDVLCVRVSPDGRLLAASLLDSTVRVYYADSLKFFLSLYGHKLPALTMDISSDSTLLVTGSADKNIKVWGLDFGDCHRSLFAHQDTVTGVAFVPDTHYAFSVSKDRQVRYWDLDRFEMLLELPGHHGEVWALALSAYGDFVLTGSHDRSIRRWERTSEPFFVEEEKERRLESLFEADLEQQQQRLAREGAGPLVLGAEGAAFGAPAGGGEGAGAGGEGAAAPAGRRTLESVSAADAIVDALDVAAHEADKEAEYRATLAAAKPDAAAAAGPGGKARKQLPKRPPPNPLMLGLSPEAYVLRAVGTVRANDLEQALLLLPFGDALRLLQWVSSWLGQGVQVELSCRVATLLLRLHHTQLTATPSARQSLVDLHTRLRGAVQGLRDTLGFNIAALKYLQRLAREQAGVDEADVVQAARRQLLAGAEGPAPPA